MNHMDFMKRSILCALVLVSALSSQADTHYRGDVNNDGLVDLADMAALATAIKEGKSEKAFDLNVSGKVDETDLHILAISSYRGNWLKIRASMSV